MCWPIFLCVLDADDFAALLAFHFICLPISLCIRRLGQTILQLYCIVFYLSPGVTLVSPLRARCVGGMIFAAPLACLCVLAMSCNYCFLSYLSYPFQLSLSYTHGGSLLPVWGLCWLHLLHVRRCHACTSRLM